ncbi:MAG: hypothetical protein GY936_10885 [Ignavibacteriae bacterium]|nr:hypothetical protein [Ignavibacteriota bacterium]
MEWLEVIELRSVDRNLELLITQLQGLIDDLEKETIKQVIKIYQRTSIDSDFSIHLFHNSEKIEYRGSQLALHIASTLREFGLVNHSIWTEMNYK